MCFNRKLKKQIAELQASVTELNKTIVTEELKRLRIEERDYKETRSELEHVKLKLKSVKIIDNDEDLPHIEVSYTIPNCKLYLDANGKIIRNETFKAINVLGLLSMSDMEKISDAIKKFQSNT